MMAAAELYLLWLLPFLQTLSAFGAELSSEACREMGFSSNLLCSSCDLLGEFSLTQLEPFCRKCCQEEAQLESRKLYPGAILEVCG
uniref:Selenoprotein F n=2 Tax=Astyanax mexicanus TaxID=7994 RepID=A0A8B9KAG7_ASTMX